MGWTYEADGVVSDENGYPIAAMFGTDAGDESRGKLIAAAPQLAEALQACLKHLDSWQISGPLS